MRIKEIRKLNQYTLYYTIEYDNYSTFDFKLILDGRNGWVFAEGEKISGRGTRLNINDLRLILHEVTKLNEGLK